MKAIKKRVALAGAGALLIAPIWAIPAQAASDGDNVVINEVYARGGSANQLYTHRFIELYNPTDEAISLDGMSIQYFAAGGANAATVLPLTDQEIPADGYFLIGGSSNGDVGDSLPEPDAQGPFAMQGSNGSVALVNGTTGLTGVDAGDVRADERFIDFVGYGTSNKFETAAAETVGGNSRSGSITRTEGVDTDNNLEDFDFVDVPTPTNSAGETGGGGEEPGPDPEPVDLTIADIQGTGDTTPYDRQQVTTRGVVTAIYEDGGYNGVVIQTPGTGGEIGDASHGIFVYSRPMASDVDFGDYIEVTGQAGEYNGLTQISGNPTFTIVDEEFDAPVAAVVTPDDLATDAQREALESMLLDVSDVEFTVTDTYQTNRYGEVALAMDDAPLPTPTDVFNPVAEEAEHDALVAENYAKMLTLGDGASWDLTRFDQNNDEIPVPYLNLEVPVRVGAGAEITEPVVLDYRFQWNLQPTEWITGENDDFVVFEDTRAEIVNAPEVEGDITISTFNVLNYFSSLGADEQGCQYYEDRDGNPVTANWCDVRGAYSQEAFERQEGKIVAAINELDASIVGLEEIENSAPFTADADRDVALRTLVAALNEDAGSEKWGYAESPEAVPATADEDVIRLAFIYQVDEVAPTAESKILIGHPDYHNAREPLGQSWKALDADGEQVGEEFATIVNHFKSKGSGTNDGTGQGNANPDRIRQANGLLEFADEEYGDMPVFLVGDFNAYNAEDPLRAFEADGYTNLLLDQGEKDGVHYFTYTFDKRIGSLDHIFADEDAYDWVLETAVWNINSPEAIGLEYSRHNYNVTNLFEADNPFRSSDHDPIIVGLDIPGFQDEDPIIVVTPEEPTFANNAITIPVVEGVEYVVNGEVVTDNILVAVGQTVTVTARAIEGYEIAEGAETEWSFTYVDPRVTVTPVEPGFEDNVITIPVVTGLQYKIDGVVVTGDVPITDDTTVTAQALRGYVIAEGADAEWTFEYVAPIVTPVEPGFANNVITIPVVEGVEYVVDGEVVTDNILVAVGQTVTVTARAAEGYELAEDAVTEWTFEYVSPITEVTPVKPEFEDNVITIPEVTGLQYLIDGDVVSGDVPITDDTTVTAQALRGYAIAEGADSEWTFEYVAPIVPVTPEAPTFVDNVIMIPEVEGVEYLIDGDVVESGTVTITEDTTVTARALEGFELAEGATAEWTFEYVAPAPPTGNVFFFVNDWTSPQADLVISFGKVGDEIYVGDWDGDGKDTLAIRSGNTFYLHNDLVDGDPDVTFNYGRVGDEVFVGDFDGDGVDTFGVRRSTTFYVQNELVGGNAELEFKYGRVGDEILIGDWDGDDKDTIMVRRDKTYFANNTLVGGNAETEFHYGRSGDAAFAGDFDGDGKDSLVLSRGNVFYINNQLVGGNADSTIGYGRASDHVMIGDWDGDGIDTPAVNRVVR